MTRPGSVPDPGGLHGRRRCGEVRQILADVLDDPAAADLPDDTPLLTGGLGLDSVTVVRLLAAIQRRLGLDVADRDLNLDSLATLGTLAAFVAEQLAGGNSDETGEVGGGMRIGFVGTGHVGGTLARLLSRAGHEVEVSNSRGPATLTDLVADLGPSARAGTVAEAAAFGDVVFLAFPYGRYRDLPAEPFTGKIVVDANNYYPRRDGHLEEIDSGKATSTGLIAAHLPGARVLKGFNTLNYRILLEHARPGAPARDRLAIAIAGDDAEAKAVLTDLIDQIGFTAVDAGALDESWRQEPGSPAFGSSVGPDQATALIAQARRKG